MLIIPSLVVLDFEITFDYKYNHNLLILYIYRIKLYIMKYTNLELKSLKKYVCNRRYINFYIFAMYFIISISILVII